MKFIGKNANLYSPERLIDRLNSKTLNIGVIDESSYKRYIKINKQYPELATVTRLGTKRRAIDPVHTRLTTTKYRAKKRGLDHNLTHEFIENFLTLSCVYCGIECTPQLDRKDNLKGYTMDNVVPACKRCNTVKSMYLSYDDMMMVAKALGWRDI